MSDMSERIKDTLDKPYVPVGGFLTEPVWARDLNRVLAHLMIVELEQWMGQRT